MFTIATVCVYGLSIVAFIAGHLQKGQMNKDEENQISSYLKRMHLGEPGKMDREYHVIRFKSRLLADSAFGQRHNRRDSLVPRGPRNFVMQRGDPPETCGGGGGGSNDDADREDDDGSDEEEGGRVFLPRRSLFNGDCVQVVDERLQQQTASPAAAVGYSRRRRQGIVGISAVNCGAGDRCAGSRGGGGGGGGAGSSAGPLQRSPWAVQCPLPKIEEDELSANSSSDSLLSCQRRDSSNSQSSSPRQSSQDNLSPNQQTDSFSIGESADSKQSVSDNQSTSHEDWQLSDQRQASIHTQPVSMNSSRRDPEQDVLDNQSTNKEDWQLTNQRQASIHTQPVSMNSSRGDPEQDVSDNQSTNKEDWQLTNQLHALVHTQPVPVNCRREDEGSSWDADGEEQGHHQIHGGDGGSGIC